VAGTAAVYFKALFYGEIFRGTGESRRTEVEITPVSPAESFPLSWASPSLLAPSYSHHDVMGTEQIIMHTATHIPLLRRARTVCAF
jgi:hypothetical protein